MRRSPLRDLLVESLLELMIDGVNTRRDARRLADDLISGRTDVRAFCVSHGMDPKHETTDAHWGGHPVTYLIRMDIPGYSVGRCPIKIGRSRSAEMRIAAILTSSPFPLTLLADVPEWLLSEGELHARFQYARIRGEWFRPVADLRRLAKEIAGLRTNTKWCPPETVEDAVA